MRSALDETIRACGGRILSALAARFRDFDAAEEAFAAACLKAVERMPEPPPADVAAWLFRTAERCLLDARRREKVRQTSALEEPPAPPTAEELLAAEANVIPDERLRLIFVCCHPAVSPDGRAPLTLRVVLGLSLEEIARAFMISPQTLAQRLVRAKRKIAEAGISFEVPGPETWNERLEAVLSTIEVSYAKAYEDAAGTGPHATYAEEMLRLTSILAELVPSEPDVLGLAATVHYAEARRPARVDERGRMVPLSEQDPKRWSRPLIERGEAFLRRAARLQKPTERELHAAIHGAWCSRTSVEEPPPWDIVLGLYDMLLSWRDDPIVRVNRVVALAEVAGAAPALAELERMDRASLDLFVPYHVVRADLLRRASRTTEARAAYARALELGVPDAERLFIEDRMGSIAKPASL